MPSSDRDLAYLWDILKAAQDIVEFTQDMSFNQFNKDKKTRFAVERQLLIIGEAANHISESFQVEHPEIPWRRIIGQRNVLAHEYGEILVERIWLVATEDIPVLVNSVSRFVPDI